MIYMVECALGPEQGAEDWERWYATMKPPALLLSVPGLLTAQRFKGLQDPPAYLAVYTVTSGEVLDSETYRGLGGGNFLTDAWKPLITYWHRNLFEGAERAPAVPVEATLALYDADEPRGGPPGLPLIWLKTAGLARSVAHRGFAVLNDDAARRLAGTPGLKLFKPRIARAVQEVPAAGAS